MSTSGWAAIASPTVGPVPGHEVEHAGRQPDLVDDLGEDEGVDRGDLARLEHDRAAGGHGEGDLGGDLVQRVVPRRDAADDADRLADDQRVADLLLELVALGQSRPPLEAVDRQPDLDELRQPLGHPRLLGDRGGDLVGAGAEGVADPAEVLGSLLDRGRRPRLEGAALAAATARSTSAAVPAGMRRHHLLGDRVDHVDGVLSRPKGSTRRRCRASRRRSRRSSWRPS